MESLTISIFIIFVGAMAAAFAFEALWNAKEMPDDFEDSENRRDL